MFVWNFCYCLGPIYHFGNRILRNTEQFWQNEIGSGKEGEGDIEESGTLEWAPFAAWQKVDHYALLSIAESFTRI